MIQTIPQNVVSFWKWWNTPIATERNKAFQEQVLRILVVIMWITTIVTTAIGMFISFQLFLLAATGFISNSVASYTISKGNTIVTELTISIMFIFGLIAEIHFRTVYSRYLMLILLAYTIIGLLLFTRTAPIVLFVYIGLGVSIVVSGITKTTTEQETIDVMSDLLVYGMLSILPLLAFRKESQRRLDEMARLTQESVDARQEAEEANQLKSRFLATVSHELRTPLNAILNFSKFVSTGRLGDVNERQVKALNNVIGSGDHLLALINDILDISKIESGSLKLYIESDVDLKKIVDNVISVSEPLIGEKPIKMLSTVADDIPLISCDRQRLHQILLNLISNACKFTDSGQISVNAKRDENDTVVIAVADTGFGIPAEDQEKIFEVFIQTERGIAQGEGTGLGLAISKRLAEAHDGKLWVESTVGQGATFFLSLPLRTSLDDK